MQWPIWNSYSSPGKETLRSTRLLTYHMIFFFNFFEKNLKYDFNLKLFRLWGTSLKLHPIISLSWNIVDFLSWLARHFCNLYIFCMPDVNELTNFGRVNITLLITINLIISGGWVFTWTSNQGASGNWSCFRGKVENETSSDLWPAAYDSQGFLTLLIN